MTRRTHTLPQVAHTGPTHRVSLGLIVLIFVLVLPVAVSAQWERDFDQTLERAQDQETPVLVVVTADVWCDPCIWFGENTLTNPRLLTEIRDGWLAVRLRDTDPAVNRLAVERLPTVILLDSTGTETARTVGAVTVETLLRRMQEIGSVGRDAQEADTDAAETARTGEPSPDERTAAQRADDLQNARYRIGTGTLWNDGGATWYTEDAGLPLQLIEYDRDESFLYLQDRSGGSIVAITIAPRVDPSLWRWDQDARTWVEVGALERLNDRP